MNGRAQKYRFVPLVALGVLVLGVAIGVFWILRQRTVIRAEKQRKEDRVRRLQDYRRDPVAADGIDGRREPYIGTRDRRVALRGSGSSTVIAARCARRCPSL